MKQRFFLDTVYCNRKGGAVLKRDHFTIYFGFILGLQTVSRFISHVITFQVTRFEEQSDEISCFQ